MGLKSISFTNDTNTRHSVYIRTVSSEHMLSAFLNWIKLVYGPFGQSNMQPVLYTQLLPRPARKELNVPKLKSIFNLGKTIVLHVFDLGKVSQNQQLF